MGEPRRRNQNDPCKQALARLIKSRTVVSDVWISHRLKMGFRSNIVRAVSAYREPVDRKRKRLKMKLTICAD